MGETRAVYPCDRPSEALHGLSKAYLFIMASSIHVKDLLLTDSGHCGCHSNATSQPSTAPHPQLCQIGLDCPHMQRLLLETLMGLQPEMKQAQFLIQSG